MSHPDLKMQSELYPFENPYSAQFGISPGGTHESASPAAVPEAPPQDNRVGTAEELRERRHGHLRGSQAAPLAWPPPPPRATSPSAPRSTNLRGTLSREPSPERHALTDAEDEPEHDNIDGILEDLAHEPIETRMAHVEKTILADHQQDINGMLQRTKIL